MDKNENKRVSIDALNKCYAKQCCESISTTIELCGMQIHVKKSVPVSQFAAGIMTGVNLCFDGGEYIPWIKDTAYMYSTIITFTDIEFNMDMEDEFFLLTVTKVFNDINGVINCTQSRMFEKAFNEQLKARLDKIKCAREEELDEALGVLRSVAQKYNEVAAVFKEIMGSDLSDIVSTFSKNAGALKESVGLLKEEFDKYISEQGDIGESV